MLVSNKLSQGGLSKHPLYRVWNLMYVRCHDIDSDNFPNYGGSGITVCLEWRYDFIPFYDWAIANGWEPGLQIDRIDNEEGYSPANCRFVTSKVNNNNKRNNFRVNYNGEEKTMAQWADHFGIKYHVLYDQFKRANSDPSRFEECLTKIKLRYKWPI